MVPHSAVNLKRVGNQITWIRIGLKRFTVTSRISCEKGYYVIYSVCFTSFNAFYCNYTGIIRTNKCPLLKTVLLVFFFVYFFLFHSCHIDKLATLLGMDGSSLIYWSEQHVNF